MSDRTPAEALARARWDRELDPDHPWYVAWDDVSPRLRQEQVEFAEADIELLAAAGYRVVPIPDDNAREDASALVWACSTALLFGPSSRKRMADLLAAAYLDGQPQDRPDRCPNPECDEGVIRPSGNCGFDDDGAMLEVPCSDPFHVGGSGDTR